NKTRLFQQKIFSSKHHEALFTKQLMNLPILPTIKKTSYDAFIPQTPSLFMLNVTKRRMTSLGKTQGKLVILGFKLLKDIDTKHYEVMVISPSTPLLASSSVGTLEFRCVVEPVRRYSPKIQYYQAYADSVDLEKKIIHCTSNLDRKKDKFDIQYDTLVVAVGANSNTFCIPGVGDYALFLKDISDARKIRQRVIECFEHASQPNVTKEEAAGLLHFAVVGGGPTGVEFSAELHDFITEDMARLYPNLINSVTMTVYDVAPQILGSFDQSLRDYAIKKFTRKGIHIRTGARVETVKERHLIINDIGEVPYGMLVWATGLTDNPLTRAMGEHIMQDQSAKRLLTDHYLRVLSKDNGMPINNV
ncbi:1730_t:CDS:2, partial [Racocetra persica]